MNIEQRIRTIVDTVPDKDRLVQDLTALVYAEIEECFNLKEHLDK